MHTDIAYPGRLLDGGRQMWIVYITESDVICA